MVVLLVVFINMDQRRLKGPNGRPKAQRLYYAENKASNHNMVCNCWSMMHILSASCFALRFITVTNCAWVFSQHSNPSHVYSHCVTSASPSRVMFGTTLDTDATFLRFLRHFSSMLKSFPAWFPWISARSTTRNPSSMIAWGNRA